MHIAHAASALVWTISLASILCMLLRPHGMPLALIASLLVLRS